MTDGILSPPIDLDRPRHSRPDYEKVAATTGLVVEHRASGVVGAIVSFKPQQIVVRDRHERDRALEYRDGAFLVAGRPVALRSPGATEVARPAKFTASGSLDLGVTPARVARASRIWVEGTHDAELIEKVWGDDLRFEGIVVEQIEGMDGLADRIGWFRPHKRRRLGILLDHLVEGSKESREAAEITDRNVLVTGHPYVDVWQVIKPESLGIDAWPVVPMGTDWKSGVMSAFGYSGDAGTFWKKLLGRVESYKDLERPMVGAVERLIDFVAQN